MRCSSCQRICHKKCIDIVLSDRQPGNDVPFVCDGCEKSEEVTNRPPNFQSIAPTGENTKAFFETPTFPNVYEAPAESDTAPIGSLNTEQFKMIMQQFELMNSQLISLKSDVAKCNKNTEDSKQLLAKFEEDIGTCFDEISELRRENKDLRARMAELENRPQDPAANSNQLLAEAMERLDRSRNVIISGIPESPQLDEDLNKIETVIAPFSPDTNKICSIIRIGKESATRPRLVKVEFPDTGAAKRLLRNGRKLTEANKGVYIRSDWTISQRESYRKLRRELQHRQREGEKDLTIRFTAHQPTITTKERAKSTKRIREEETSPRNGEGSKISKVVTAAQ